jgi:hypothetical protein
VRGGCEARRDGQADETPRHRCMSFPRQRSAV